MNARERVFPADLQGMQEGWRKKRHAGQASKNQSLVRETLRNCNTGAGICAVDCKSVATVYNPVPPSVWTCLSIRGRSRNFVMDINTAAAFAEA